MYSDWELDSELTELSTSSSEDEEDWKPGPKRAASAKAATKEYTIAVMRPPRTTSYSADWVFTQITEGLIDLDPSYQRDIVWPEHKQIGLVDSLLRNYYIPPVIFAVQRSSNGFERRICIDGKQRLTSIRRFMEGEIYHKDGNKRYWYTQSVKRTLLPNSYRQAFSAKQIVCVEYEDLTDDQEREIFQRVQLGVPLTPAERMQAICGPWPDLVREIQTTIMREDGFGDRFEWDRARGREFQCLSSILFLLDNHSSSSTLKFPGTPQLEKMLQQSTPIPAVLRGRMVETLRIYELLARDPDYSQCFQKLSRVSPCEFIMTGVLICMRSAEYSLPQLSAAILKMREDVRKKHPDVRQNNKVSKTMYTFMKKLRVAQLPGIGGNPPATTVLAELQTKPRKAPKRKRAADSDDEVLVKPPKVSGRTTDTQKARRSVKLEPVKRVPSGRTVTAKKPISAAPTASSSSRKGLRGSRLTAKKESSSSATKFPDFKRISSPVVQVKAESSKRRSNKQVDQPASPVTSTVELAATLDSTRNDRLAAIRKAKSDRAASMHITIPVSRSVLDASASGRSSPAVVANDFSSTSNLYVRDPRRSASVSAVSPMSVTVGSEATTNIASTCNTLLSAQCSSNRAGPSTRATTVAAASVTGLALPDVDMLAVHPTEAQSSSTPQSASTTRSELSARPPQLLGTTKPLLLAMDPGRRQRATTFATSDLRLDRDPRSTARAGWEGQSASFSRGRHASEGQGFGRT